MIIKILNKICFGLLLLTFFSCSNDENEELFGTSPSARIDQKITELQNLLLASPDGYKAVYFTKNDEFGGFTFYMKFKSDGTVDMTSDVDTETAVTTGNYEVKLGTSVELIFTTRNQIHKVSDNDLTGLRGTGYKGNSNFQYIKNEGGKITFREPRHGATLVFEPVTAAEWDNVNITLGRRSSLLPSVTSSVFQGLTIEDASGNKVVYSFDYDSLRLFVKSQNQSDGSIKEVSYGIAYTPEGLVVSPAIEIGGNSYENFIFDATSGSYVSEVGGNKATIGFIDRPTVISNDIDKLTTVGFRTFSHRVSWGTSPRTSLGFNNLITQINTNLIPDNESYNRFEILLENTNTTGTGNPGIINLWINMRGNNAATSFWANYRFEAIIIDKILRLTYLGTGNPNGNYYEAKVQPMLDFFASSDGLYFENHGSFKTDISNFSNSSASFTSLEDPALRIYGLFFGN
ncbi:uncharacterized protein DUF4302 [Aquimarina sp. MAR_2010_214]|uniref:DUF4302 domain-containing protein n=1 Tax=Aquimarina sp. MAR_2010_214 TaxID=1250026 RepID=UPI000CA7AE46|nr:DUF4302 domain-containing protein [Aquimarina sp. MAR_2010_214]PKV50464.1 uncharacterized protein DUF4302 [Aquimarina sp. MAR_2010_214]